VASIPSYGGHYVDADGKVHVYLANLADSQRAKRLAPMVRDRREGFSSSDRRPPTVAIHYGAYGYFELTSWNKTAIHHVSGIDGVRGMGVDVRHNAVRIAVDTERTGMKVLDSLAKLGVPRAAIRIELGGGAVWLE
jgi:hypothetical protein